MEKQLSKNIIFVLLMCLFTVTAYAQKEKKLKYGKFVYEGFTVDGKSPSGEGDLFVKYNFENVKLISNAIFEGWNGKGDIKCPFWTFSGDFQITKNSLILKPGSKLKLAIFNGLLPEGEKYFHHQDGSGEVIFQPQTIPFGPIPTIYIHSNYRKECIDTINVEIVKPIELDASDGISPIIDVSCLKYEVDDRLVIRQLFGSVIPYNIEEFFFDELGSVSVESTIKWVSFPGYQGSRTSWFMSRNHDFIESGYYCIKYNFDNLTISTGKNWNTITNKNTGRNFYTDRKYFISFLRDTESVIYRKKSPDSLGNEFNWRVSKIYNDGSGVSGVYIMRGSIVIDNGWANDEDLPGLNRTDLCKEGIGHWGNGSKEQYDSWLCYSDKKWITNSASEYIGNSFYLADGPRDNNLEVIKELLSAQTLPRVEKTNSGWTSLAMFEGTKQLGTIDKGGYKSVAQSDKEAAQKKAKQKAEDDAAYKQLCQMFGKKYVDALFGGRIIIGMPERLFIEGINKNMFTNITGATLSDQTSTKKYYDLKGMKLWETKSKLEAYTGNVGWVVITNGRISSIHWN